MDEFSQWRAFQKMYLESLQDIAQRYSEVGVSLEQLGKDHTRLIDMVEAFADKVNALEKRVTELEAK